MRERGLRSVGVTTALLLLLGTSSAFAHHLRRVRSTITIHYDGSAFYGDVRSRLHRCEKARTVLAFSEDSLEDRDFVGDDRTNPAGEWRIPHPVEQGVEYWAVVVRKKLFSFHDPHRTNCRSDRSPRLEPDPA
jgi:hypothetical protein